MNVWAPWLTADAWAPQPTIIAACVVFGIVYVRGVRRVATPATAGTAADNSAVGRWRRLWWWTFLASLLLATCSPLETEAAYLFSVHMVQHLLFLVVAPLLLVAAAPWAPLQRGLPAIASRMARTDTAYPLVAALRSAGRILHRPSVAWIAFVAGSSMWHLPRLYDAALANDAVHDYGEHATFVVVGTLLWLQLMDSPPLRARQPALQRLGFVIAIMLPNTILAMLLAFAPAPLYAGYQVLPYLFGVAPLTDQQIGAAIMWTFGDLPLAIAAAAFFHRWLGLQLAEGGPEDGRDPLATNVGPSAEVRRRAGELV